MADIQLQIRWGSGGMSHRDPEIRGGGADLKKICFLALQTSFWSKNKAGAAPRAPSLDPPLCGHVTSRSCVEYSVWGQSRSVV